MDELFFSFERVLVVKDKASVPRFFPAVLISPRDSGEIHHQLVDALSVDLDSFDPNAFVAIHNTCSKNEVTDACTDAQRFVKLVNQAVVDKTAILFRPSDGTNPLCDVVMVLPTAPSESSTAQQVSFVLVELRDRIQSNFGDKLDKFTTKSELLLTPVKCALGRLGITVERTVFVCCGRSEVHVQT
ncbi:hypothetical protein EON64_12055 [archaeon]|nr:MAG: hypothetical protein EON64_12055 [archaeon]